MVKNRFLWLLLIMPLTLSACAGAKKIDAARFWPGPPEEPRVAYIKSLKGENDLKKKSYFDSIFGGASDQGIQGPYGVYAANGKIFVTTAAGGGYVLVFDEQNQTLSSIGQGTLKLPIGVAVAPDGTIFVSDAKLKKIFGFDSSGKPLLSIGANDEFKNPAGLAINRKLGRIYLADSYGHAVYSFDLKGKRLFKFGVRGQENGNLHFPTNIAVDQRNGTVYVVDTQNFRVQAFDQDGNFLRKWGELGDQFGAFSRPKGIGIDSEGHVYVADAGFDNFQIFSDTGELLMFIGSAGNAPGYFMLPAGLYVDDNDRIFVTDTLNRRVQMFQYLSGKWKQEHPEEYEKYRTAPFETSVESLEKDPQKK